MKLLLITTALLLLLGTGSTYAQTTEISPNGPRRAAPAPAEYFTGSVIVEPLSGAKDGMSATGGLVTFAHGARGEKREIKPGDVIWTPPGVKHWHGATATTSMSHIAITNMVDGHTD